MDILKVLYNNTGTKAVISQRYQLNSDNTVTHLGSNTDIYELEPSTHWNSDNEQLTIVATSREQYRSIIDGLELQTDNKPHDWKNWRDWLKF